MERVIAWWNHFPQHIDPVLFQFGFFQLRYYSLMYFTALAVFYVLTMYRLRTEHAPLSVDLFERFMTYAIVGVILGARLGYVVFYDLGYFLANPLQIFLPYQVIDGNILFGISGLSYHGGLLGALLVATLFCRRHNIGFIRLADFLVPAVPLGYMFGRIGNFLNGELYGRVTQQPWGMYFPSASTYELRHPSQLYEAFFEGLVLFVILWMIRKKCPFSGFVFAIYLFGYGIVRFFIEYFRQPDAQLGFVFLNLSMGQILCLGMIMTSLMIFFWQRRSQIV